MRVSLLCSAWSSALLDEPVNAESEILKQDGQSRSSVPKAPHLENCKLSEPTNERLDKRAENESFLPRTIWKGRLDIYPSSATDEQLRYSRHQAISEGAHPPWATRYLMRFQTEYTCGLMNVARHAAFGKEAAKMVLSTLAGEWPKDKGKM
ncbi:hypothetical protein L1049_020880 [Liquidambar formosana]|uniref:Uncharacterized protein n=1 Tax=Liquidambar formosana TaxID=63359 RepID=A0AAP0X4Q0_LIQFO